MSLLIEFLEAITNVMLGVEEGVRAGRIVRASDIEPFIRRLDESVFLISAPSERARGSLATVLDRAITEIEDPSRP